MAHGTPPSLPKNSRSLLHVIFCPIRHHCAQVGRGAMTGNLRCFAEALQPLTIRSISWQALICLARSGLAARVGGTFGRFIGSPLYRAPLGRDSLPRGV